MKKTAAFILFFSGIIFSACHSAKKIKSFSVPVFDKQAHRGGRGLMPENTIPAMKNAIDLGVTTLEMDAVITKDGKVLVSHETFFNHEITTAPGGSAVSIEQEKQLNIYKMTYAETKQYDVGLKPYPQFPKQKRFPVHKPLLADLIDSVENYTKQGSHVPMLYNIETKINPGTDNIFHPAPEEFADLLMNVIKEKGIQKRVIIQSFDFRTLQLIHKKYPGIQTAALVSNKKTFTQNLNDLGFIPDIYSPAFLLVTPELVKECHDKKIRIIPWTVNDKGKIEELKKWGVDGLITDYPDLF
jgi:glycerophosphoryl diester phosphodiesterase